MLPIDPGGALFGALALSPGSEEEERLRSLLRVRGTLVREKPPAPGDVAGWLDRLTARPGYRATVPPAGAELIYTSDFYEVPDGGSEFGSLTLLVIEESQLLRDPLPLFRLQEFPAPGMVDDFAKPLPRFPIESGHDIQDPLEILIYQIREH